MSSPNIFVKSKFRARWTGIVIGIEKRKKLPPVYTVLVLRCANGAMPRKRIVHTLCSRHFDKVKPLCIEHINRDWFKQNYY